MKLTLDLIARLSPREKNTFVYAKLIAKKKLVAVAEAEDGERYGDTYHLNKKFESFRVLNEKIIISTSKILLLYCVLVIAKHTLPKCLLY